MVYEYLTKPIADGGLGIHSSCIVLHGHGLGSAVASRLAVELSKKVGALARPSVGVGVLKTKAILVAMMREDGDGDDDGGDDDMLRTAPEPILLTLPAVFPSNQLARQRR